MKKLTAVLMICLLFVFAGCSSSDSGDDNVITTDDNHRHRGGNGNDGSDDNSGNEKDTTPPTIIAISIVNGATGVELNPLIDVTYSEEMKSLGNDLLREEGNPNMGFGGVYWTDYKTRFTFAPTTLSRGTNYIYTIYMASDLAGNEMPLYTLKFRTIEVPVRVITANNNAVSDSTYNTSTINTDDYTVDPRPAVTNANQHKNPVTVAINSATQTGYGINETVLPSEGGYDVTVFNPHTNEVMGGIMIPGSDSDLGIEPAWGIINSTKLYVSRTGTNDVTVIDQGDNSIIATIANVTDASRLCGTTIINPYHNELYCLNINTQAITSDTLTVINTNTNSITNTITVGTGPVGAAVDTANNRLYVSNGWSWWASGDLATRDISVIDLNTHSLIDEISLGNVAPWGMIIDSDTGYLWIADYANNQVIVVNPATKTIVSAIAVGWNPLYLKKHAGLVYVVNYNSNSVSVIDTSTRTVIDTVPVGNNPTDLDIYVPPMP